MPTLAGKVIKYQKTRDEELFNEIYEEIEPMVEARLARYHYEPEVISKVNLAVYECITDFDPKKNANFKAYLGKYINFAVKNALRTIRRTSEREEPFEEPSHRSIAFLDVEGCCDLAEFFSRFGLSKEDQFIIKSLSNGFLFREIADELNCTVQNISQKVKRYREKYPELLEYLR